MKSTAFIIKKINFDFVRGMSRYLRRIYMATLGRMRLLWVVLLASLLLAGCVKYDVGVNFDSPNQGSIVQSIKLGERLAAFSSETVDEWLDSVEHRARQLGGKTRRVANKELTVTIPFNTGTELEAKFNQFFNPTSNKQSQPTTSTAADLPEIKSYLKFRQSNLLLWFRNYLSYDLDVRSLSVLSSTSNVIIDPNSILDLEFRLNTPGGARALKKSDSTVIAESRDNGHQLVWKLQPSQMNHIEAVFWLPNTLGIAAIVIALFIAAGIYIKYKLLPGSTKAPTSPLA